MIPLFLRNSRRALQGAHALRRVSGALLISVFRHNYLHVFQVWHNHVVQNAIRFQCPFRRWKSSARRHALRWASETKFLSNTLIGIFRWHGKISSPLFFKIGKISINKSAKIHQTFSTALCTAPHFCARRAFPSCDPEACLVIEQFFRLQIV